MTGGWPPLSSDCATQPASCGSCLHKLPAAAPGRSGPATRSPSDTQFQPRARTSHFDRLSRASGRCALRQHGGRSGSTRRGKPQRDWSNELNETDQRNSQTTKKERIRWHKRNQQDTVDPHLTSARHPPRPALGRRRCRLPSSGPGSPESRRRFSSSATSGPRFRSR